MASEGAIPLLIAYMKNSEGDIVAKQYCAMTLGNLAAEPENHMEIVKSEGASHQFFLSFWTSPFDWFYFLIFAIFLFGIVQELTLWLRYCVVRILKEGGTLHLDCRIWLRTPITESVLWRKALWLAWSHLLVAKMWMHNDKVKRKCKYACETRCNIVLSSLFWYVYWLVFCVFVSAFYLAMAALRGLCISPEFRAVVVREGILDPLVLMSRSEDVMVRGNRAWLIVISIVYVAKSRISLLFPASFVAYSWYLYP